MILKLRRANKNDLMNLFDLANDPLVRENSFNTSIIPLRDHKKWFQKKLEDKNSLILIVEKENNFVGLVRLDLQKENILSISIHRNFRGQGLGSIIISKSLSYIKKNNASILQIIAYIKPGNDASVKSFEKAGFKFEDQVKLNDHQALKYILSFLNS